MECGTFMGEREGIVYATNPFCCETCRVAYDTKHPERAIMRKKTQKVILVGALIFFGVIAFIFLLALAAGSH